MQHLQGLSNATGECTSKIVSRDGGAEPDSTTQPFAKRLVKEAGLPSSFNHPVAQSIQVSVLTCDHS